MKEYPENRETPGPFNVPGTSRPRVTLLLTGGTIGSGGSNELDRLDYVDLAKVLTDEEALPLYRFPEGVEVFTKQVFADPQQRRR